MTDQNNEKQTKNTSAANQNSANINMLMDVPLNITIELGRTQMTLRQTLDLQQGSVVALDRLAGDPVDVYVNEKLIAHGEVVVVDDKFAVRITEIISTSLSESQEE
jgi:flagellar motor switch protein FliN/FliY